MTSPGLVLTQILFQPTWSVAITANQFLVRVLLVLHPRQISHEKRLISFAVNEVLGSPYQWTVPAVAAGTYTMQLLDDGVLSDTSPSFQITSVALPPDLGNGTDGTSTSSMMSTGSSAPVTTVYWDEGCTCHKTAVVTAAAYASASAYASAGAGAGTGAEASAAAGAGAGSCAGSGCGSGSNWTAPMTTPSMSTYMPSGNGAAERLSGCMGAALAFVLIAFIA